MKPNKNRSIPNIKHNHDKSMAPAVSQKAKPKPSTPAPVAPKSVPKAPAVDPHKGHKGHEGHTMPEAPPPATSPAAPKSASASPTTKPAPDNARETPPSKGHEGHEKPGAQSAMPADMAHEMGHNGNDLPEMVRDMRNRFWICLIFTVPIFVYAPMGSFFKPPSPPFGQ